MSGPVIYEFNLRDGTSFFEMGRTEDDILAHMCQDEFPEFMDARPVDMSYVRYLFNPNRIINAYAVVNHPESQGIFLLGMPDREH